MTDLVKHLCIFLREYLPRDCNASPHTIASYAFSFKRFVQFVSMKLKCRPCQLQIDDLCVDLVLDFLDYLENDCANSIRTRNYRLAAIKSFFRYLEFRQTERLELVRQIHAIPFKRFEQKLIDTLSVEEASALINAPSNRTAGGVRDRAMMCLAYTAGLRVSELISLTLEDLSSPDLDTVRINGKGRRQRVLPIWNETKPLLHKWLAARPQSDNPHLFLNASGRAMTRQGFSQRLKVHLQSACEHQPTLKDKQVSPHTLRHGCALRILESTADIRKVSLWLGHASIQSTEIYLRADPELKRSSAGERFPVDIRKGSFKGVEDRLIQILDDAGRA